VDLYFVQFATKGATQIDGIYKEARLAKELRPAITDEPRQIFENIMTTRSPNVKLFISAMR
jgi:hypothetical protein